MLTQYRRLKRPWLFLVRLQREFGYDDCMGMAAQIAFYNLLGLFPLMIFLLNIIGLFPVGKALQSELVKELGAQMPPEAASYVADTVLGLLPAGNEGLFGIALEITQRLIARVETYRTVLAAYRSLEEAGNAVSMIVASGLLPEGVRRRAGQGGAP